jgi:D-serine deaminase-like pyridoxal phosphate-dependent protein
MHVEQLDTPALLVDLDLMEANIARLMGLLRGRARVRPHLKTAKSPEVARVLLAAGAQGCCVAKLGEAEVLAQAGVDDLLITSEIVGAPKLARLAALLRRHAGLRAVVDSLEGARGLDAAAAESGSALEVLIDINVGQNRTGVLPGEPALELARGLAGLRHLRLAGVQGYEGHLQHLADPAEKARRVAEAMELLVGTAELLRGAGFAAETVTTGGTGTCLLCVQNPGVTEVQPGSFAFMDTAYRDALGPEASYANALVVLATVISRAERRAVVDAGLKALASDMGTPQPRDLPGVSYRFGGDEHGILEWGPGVERPPAVGDLVALIPGHIDPTINLYDTYHLHRGGEIAGTWSVAARGKTQ